MSQFSLFSSSNTSKMIKLSSVTPYTFQIRRTEKVVSICVDCSHMLEKPVLNRDVMHLCFSLAKLFRIRVKLRYIIVQRSPLAIAKDEDTVLSKKFLGTACFILKGEEKT